MDRPRGSSARILENEPVQGSRAILRYTLHTRQLSQALLSIALTVSLAVAVASAVVAGALIHGVLRPQLEGRGVKPWRLRDTLMSIPLVLIGSAGVGGSVSLGALALTPLSATEAAPLALLVGALCGLLVSAFVLLLGVIALRKLAPESAP